MELNGSSDDVENSYNLGSFFFRCMSRHGNTISQYVADTGVENTYQELLTRSIRVALKLREKGIGKNDIVSTCTHNNEHSCLPTIATQYLGGITANFDPDLSHLDTIKLLELIRPKMMFVPKQCLGFMEECLKKANIETMIVVFGTATNYEQFSDYLEPHPLEENFKPAKSGDNRETAVIMFSSGTTGFPKAICLSHYSLLEFTKNNNISSEQLGGEIKVWLSYPSLYWISALVMLIRGTMNGYARVVSPAFEAVNTWKLIDEYMVNSIFLPPYQAADFLNKRPKNTDASSLEYLMTGTCSVSEKLMKDLKEALPNTVVVQGYGQTETAGLITNFDVSKPEELEFQNKKPASCGKIIGGIKWKVIDIHTEELLGPYQEGELHIKRDTFMNGYYKMDTSSAYDADGYLKTGDLVYYDDDECFYVKDRLKEIFKYRGWHILPAMLEEILLNHPAVKEAAVVGIPHELDGGHPMGFVVLLDGFDDVTAEEIGTFFEKQVSDCQKLRAGLRIVEEIPRTATGKIMRRVIKEMVLNNESAYTGIEEVVPKKLFWKSDYVELSAREF